MYEWYLKFGEKIEGPYSKEDLKNDQRVNASTLGKKNDYIDWIPLGEIKELSDIFNVTNSENKERSDDESIVDLEAGDEIVLENKSPKFTLGPWLIIFFLLGVIAWYFFR